jgi:hypothetical protein
VSAGAQTTPAPGATPVAKSPQAATKTGHHKGSAMAAKHDPEMMKECQAMMAKKQEMMDKHKEMDATLDKLVAEMNAAKGSKEVDAMEKPMAAVINELVTQRKAMHSMMMEMQPEMMSHMMHHMKMKDMKGMHGGKGMMECPMMKMDKAPETKAGEMDHKM